jgi:cyanate permease
MNWLPPYLVQDRGIAFSMELGAVVIVPFLGLDLGYLVSGFAVLTLSRRGWTVPGARRFVLVLSAAIMSISLAATPFVATEFVTVALLFAGAFGMACWNSNYLCFVEEVSPRKAAAVAGVVGSAGAFAGAVSLWVIGVIAKSTGSFTSVFVMIAGLIWIASAGILLTRDPYPTETGGSLPAAR